MNQNKGLADGLAAIATIAGAKLLHARSATRARPVRLYGKAGSIAEIPSYSVLRYSLVVLSAKTCIHRERETVSQECQSAAGRAYKVPWHVFKRLVLLSSWQE
jgi:hypothetical protein